MPEHVNRKVRIGSPSRQLRIALSQRGISCAASRCPRHDLTRQVAAWRDSWLRLPDDAETRQQFLDRVGRYLGETEGEASVKRAREVLGITN